MDNIVRINIDTYSLLICNEKPMLRIIANFPEKFIKKDNTTYKLSKIKKAYFLSAVDRYYNFQISDTSDEVNGIAFSDVVGMLDLTHILKSSDVIIMTPGYTKIVNEIHSTIKAYVNEVIVKFLLSYTFKNYDGYKLTISDAPRVLSGMYDSDMLDLYSRAMLVNYCKDNSIDLLTEDYKWYNELPYLQKY